MKAPEGQGPHLSAIHVYPLKSAAGIALSSVAVDEVGLRYDRRWMLIDEEGDFLSQRTHPRMAHLGTALENDALRISAPGCEPLKLPLAGIREGGRFVTVRVWHEDRYAADCGAESAQWASAFMGFPCRIVKAVEPVAGPRISDSGWVRAGFADAEPALVISTASLDDLNTRLTEALPMNRFRPNLVVSFVPAYSEDRWATVRIGDVPVRGSRRCPRCALTTVDQGTGIKGREPLRTLATYRRVGSGEVVFGMNVRFERAGVLRVGDAIVAVS